MSLRFVITGTDTNVGKTIFSAALAHALSAHYWKPIQSGLCGETDSETVIRLGGIPKARILPEIWKFNTPVSPHLAAKLDQVTLDLEQLTLPSIHSPLIIEGAGGLLVPLTSNVVFADIFAKWQVPVILCARTELGTINHTLLSIEAMRKRAIPIFGVVFIGNEQLDTQNTIAELGSINVLGRVPWCNPLSSANLHQSFQENFSVSTFVGI